MNLFTINRQIARTYIQPGQSEDCRGPAQPVVESGESAASILACFVPSPTPGRALRCMLQLLGPGGELA